MTQDFQDDKEIDRLMNAAFAGDRPDAGLEDRVITNLRDADRWRLRRFLLPRMPQVAVHPLVRRAAVGVAAAILLGTAGFVATRVDQAASNNRFVTRLGGSNTQVDLLVDGEISRAKVPLQSPRQMANVWTKSATGTNTVDYNWSRAGTDAKQADDFNGRVILGKPVTPMLRSLNESVAGAPAAESKPKAGVTVTTNGEASGRSGNPTDRFNYYDVTYAGAPRPVVPTPRDNIPFKPQILHSVQQGQQQLRGQPWDQYDSFMLPTDDDAGDGGTAANGAFPVLKLRAAQPTAAVAVVPGQQAATGGVPAARGLIDGKKADDSLGQKDGKDHDTDLGTDFGDTPNFALDQNQDAGQGGGGGSAGRGVFGSDGGQAAKPVVVAQAAETASAAQNPQPQQPQQPPAPEAQQATRKIIRNGEMTFEVDGYDSAVVQITKIAAEEGGFVATTQSEKLPNGKVTGSVVVRCPPERLDTLVLKLRGLGDLKNSRIAATDITKQYTDLDAQLRAARTMEERLLEIIKTGKGTVKELLEAEKQLGTWREKIERLEGEIRYYNNLVSLSTLNITLAERDVRAAALLSESEQVNMAVEAEDVEKARAEALKAIDDAKGRIVESDLKKHDAGQFAATIVAEVSPDAAGPVIDRLKQLGRVARMDVQRRQTTAEGTGAPVPGARVERKDTRLMLSVYNLANVAPRNTTSVQLAADDVEKSYRAILAQVESAGGRVVNSQLAKPTPEQTTGTITFETPAGAADVLLDAVRGAGEVMRLDTSTNPDTQNVTDAKRGFTVNVRSLASVPPRETTSLRVAAADVPGAFNKLRETVRAAGGAVRTSQLADQQDSRQVTGQLDVELKRDAVPGVQAALAEAGATIAREVGRSNDVENTTDAKVMFRVTLVDERTVPAREEVTLKLAVDDVATKYDKLLTALRDAGARVVVSQIDQKDPLNTSASLQVDVRRDHRAAVDKALADAGGVFGRAVSRPAEGQAALEDKVRLNVTLHDADNLDPREKTTMGVETSDVAKAAGDIEATAVALGGRKVDSDWAQQPSGQTIARVVVDVPLARSAELIAKARDAGTVLSLQRDQTPNAPEGPFARARLSVTVATADAIVERNQGLGASIRSGLSTSVEWLLKSVTLIVIGVCLVAPWAIVLWVVWKVVKRRKGVVRPAGTS